MPLFSLTSVLQVLQVLQMDSFKEFLRKVTPHNIQHQVSILKKQSVLWSGDTLVKIVTCIFEKVSAEPPDQIYLYVYTCKMMLEFEVKKNGSKTKKKTVTFQDVMQSRARFHLTEILKEQEKGEKMKSKAGKKAVNELDAVCSFLSQLFIQDVLSSDTLLFCINSLKAHNTEFTWQCLSKLLKNSFAHIESLGTSHLFKPVFQTIYKKIQRKRFSVQTRFMLCDLYDLKGKKKKTVEAQFRTFDKIRRDANIKDEIGHQTKQKRHHGQVPSNSSEVPSPSASPGAQQTLPHNMSTQGVRHSGQQPMSLNHQQALLYRMQLQAGQMHSMGFGIPSAAAPRTTPMQPASATTIAPDSAGPRIMQHGTASGAHCGMQNPSFVPQHTMMQPAMGFGIPSAAAPRTTPMQPASAPAIAPGSAGPRIMQHGTASGAHCGMQNPSFVPQQTIMQPAAMFTPRTSNQYPQAATPFPSPYFQATQYVQQNQGYYPPGSQIPQASYSTQVMETQQQQSRNEREIKILSTMDPTSGEDLTDSILRERDGVVVPASSQVAGAGPSSSQPQNGRLETKTELTGMSEETNVYTATKQDQLSLARGQRNLTHQLGKRKYARDFLLGFQSDCTCKPEGMPDVVIEKNQVKVVFPKDDL